MSIYGNRIQVIPQTPGAGEMIGQQFGAGLSSGLQMLMQSKMKGMQERERLKQIQGLVGLDQPVPREQETVLEETLTEDYAPSGRAKNIEDITEGQLRAVALLEPQYGKFLQEQKKAAEKKIEKTEQRAFERNKKYLEKTDEERMSMPKKKLALTQMQTALETGDFESLRNTVADYTGLEFLKTASAQSVNAAIKEYLIGDLASLTGRPNQFIERQITKALINPQYAPEANKVILEGLQGLQKLKEREIDLVGELEEKYTEQGKEIPRNFQRIVKKKLEKEVQEFEEGYKKRIEDIFKPKQERISLKKVPQGTRITVDIVDEFLKKAGNDPEKARELARKAGYEF